MDVAAVTADLAEAILALRTSFALDARDWAVTAP